MSQNNLKYDFFKELDLIIYNINESNSTFLNEGKFFDSLKIKIKNFLAVNKKIIHEKLPDLLNYIKNSKLSIKYKKEIFLFIVLSLLSLGVNINDTKDIFKQQNIDSEISWNYIKSENILDVSKLKSPFSLGEYNYNENDIDIFYNEIKKQLIEKHLSVGDSVIYVKGYMVVTISEDPSNPFNRNFAIDDTPEEKEKGGNLLNKRIKSINDFIKKLNSKLFEDSIILDIKVIGTIDKDRIYAIKKLTYVINNNVSYSVDDQNKREDEYTDKDNLIKPNITGGLKDIKNLSRNYQFVELLKLGNINAKRFNGDKINLGDKYSLWIVDTRKHIKDFLTRLQNNYPEYNIYFDKSVKAITPISGSIAGVSNVDKQYSIVPEKYIMKFNTFLLENKNDNIIYNKWIKILGNKFPDLTVKQAESFHKNIKIVLHYLEQMYGNSILDFKIIED
jgi:hypothetical protein